jgi:hypothetical protein
MFAPSKKQPREPATFGYQPITSGSPPMFNFAHCPNFSARRLDRDDVPE